MSGKFRVGRRHFSWPAIRAKTQHHHIAGIAEPRSMPVSAIAVLAATHWPYQQRRMNHSTSKAVRPRLTTYHIAGAAVWAFPGERAIRAAAAACRHFVPCTFEPSRPFALTVPTPLRIVGPRRPLEGCDAVRAARQWSRPPVSVPIAGWHWQPHTQGRSTPGS